MCNVFEGKIFGGGGDVVSGNVNTLNVTVGEKIAGGGVRLVTDGELFKCGTVSESNVDKCVLGS